MKHLYIVAALMGLAAPLAGQVPIPAGAVPVTLRQINTLQGQTTWVFNDPAGDTFYLQAPAYLTIQIPGSASNVSPISAPGLWIAPAVVAPPTSTASPDLTAISNNSGTIVDANGGKWTILNGVVELNGASIGYSSGVIKLVTVKGVLWQQNAALNWYYWNTTSKEWDGGAAPI